MKKINLIPIKAALLLIAFSLNSIIGFACAIGLDMSFNSKHHCIEKATIAETANHHPVLNHCHKEDITKHRQTKNAGNCCHDKVVKFAHLDKIIPQPFSISVNSFFLYPSSPAFTFNVLFNSFKKPLRYLAQFHHPPISDIRIAIKSFQI